ncbi:MAG: hypothetical protein AAF447_17875 [Myxococcota bacterium]
MSDEQIHGLTLQDVVEITSKHGALRAEHGEPGFTPYFQQFLASKGIDENTWAHAHNGWTARMEADPSGQLYARFATLQQQASMAAHHADVPDASGDVKGGISLEGYAKIMAGLAGNKELGPMLAEAGLTEQQWLTAQSEWNAAMGADVNHHLTTQYGQLYAKYTPNFQQQMQGQVAATMAARHAERAAGEPDEPEEDYELPHAQKDMASPNPHDRYRGAYHALHMWDLGDRSDPALRHAAGKAHAIALQCVEGHDEFTVSDAEGLAGKLKMLAEEGFMDREQADEAKGAIARCLNRAREALATRQAAFAPIANKAVPERVKLQSMIQDYTSLVGELEEILEEWDDIYQAPEAAAAPSAPASSGMEQASPSTAMEPAGGGLLDLLKSLPIIGNILRALGL